MRQETVARLFEQNLRHVADFGILSRQERAVVEITLEKIVRDEHPERIVGGVVDMLFADSRASESGERAADRFRGSEGIGVCEQGEREVARPRQTVPLDAVDQKVSHAEAQSVSGAHPDAREFRVGSERSGVADGSEFGVALRMDRVFGFRADVAERQRQRGFPDAGGGLDQLQRLFAELCAAVFRLEF